MIKLIKGTHFNIILLLLALSSALIEAKHYSREKQDECMAVSNTCQKCINSAIKTKEICDILAENRSQNYLEDKETCITRCKDTIAACNASIEQCKNHLRNVEDAKERRIMQDCIKQCKKCIAACKNCIKKCHVFNDKANCVKACEQCSAACDACIDACLEVTSEKDAMVMGNSHNKGYSSDEYEYED